LLHAANKIFTIPSEVVESSPGKPDFIGNPPDSFTIDLTALVARVQDALAIA